MARIGDALRALPSADAAEFYTSGRTSNEAAFLYQLFARAFGTNNFPDCSNMCHEATSVGLPESIGVGKGTVTLEDFDHCNAIFCLGHNPGTNHPRMLSTLRAAARRGAQIVVVNSLRERGLERFTSPQNAAEMSLGMSTSIATMYVQPRVGGDAAVLKGMMKALLETDRDARATLLPAVVDHDFIARHTLVVPAGVPAQEAVAGSYGLVFWGAVSPYSKRGRVRAFENLVCIVHTSLQEATTAARERGTRGFSVFVQVAETRSFVAAGRLLGVSASAIGKSVARLEETLGVRLFHRSTRSITLTAEGVLFLERSRRILAEIEAAEQEPSQATAAPRGRLRVSLPLVSSLVLPVLGEFMREYPDIELDLDFTDQMVDVIDEGFDAIVRTGAPADSRLSARRLGSFQMMLVASPDYLARRGTPQVPADLRGHACLHFRYPNTGKLEAWPLRLPRGDAELSLPTSMVCNNIETRVCFALQGLGIACLPDFSVRGPLADGRLRHVLPDHVDRTGGLPRAMAGQPAPFSEGARPGGLPLCAGLSGRCDSVTNSVMNESRRRPASPV